MLTKPQLTHKAIGLVAILLIAGVVIAAVSYSRGNAAPTGKKAAAGQEEIVSDPVPRKARVILEGEEKPAQPKRKQITYTERRIATLEAKVKTLERKLEKRRR
jgi:flagellar motility protein MotE (MotC chaperone)